MSVCVAPRVNERSANNGRKSCVAALAVIHPLCHKRKLVVCHVEMESSDACVSGLDLIGTLYCEIRWNKSTNEIPKHEEIIARTKG